MNRTIPPVWWQGLLMAIGLALPASAHAASCDPVAAFAKQNAIPPQACKVIDNGSVKQRVCVGDTPDVLRVEIAERPNAGPIDATHVVTWFNDVPRSDPSGASYTLSGTLFIGTSQVLSIRYKDFTRGDSAVAGGFKTPEDQVEVQTAPAGSMNCKSLPLTSDAEVDAVVAELHANRR